MCVYLYMVYPLPPVEVVGEMQGGVKTNRTYEAFRHSIVAVRVETRGV